MNTVNNPAWFVDHDQTPIEQLIQVHVEIEHTNTTDYVPCTINNIDSVISTGQVQNIHYSIKGVSEAKYILKRRKELSHLPTATREKILNLAADKLHFWIDEPSIDYTKDINWLKNRKWSGRESPKVINKAYNKK